MVGISIGITIIVTLIFNVIAVAISQFLYHNHNSISQSNFFMYIHLLSIISYIFGLTFGLLLMYYN